MTILARATSPALAGRRHLMAALAATVLLAVVVGCTPAPEPGDPEEVPTLPEDVPPVVTAAAETFGARLGGAHCKDWAWDTESDDWECEMIGLTRQAELDVTPEGGFAELELVYDFAEIAEALPDVADLIQAKCRGENGVFIELSLRRDAFLDDLPTLEDAWSASGVVLEFQCPNGRDFELDARKMLIVAPVDDTSS
jgi:hypothetical protein